MRLVSDGLEGRALPKPPLLFVTDEPNIPLLPNCTEEPAGLLKGEFELNTLDEFLVELAGFPKVAWPNRPPAPRVGVLEVFGAFKIPQLPETLGADAGCVADSDPD